MINIKRKQVIDLAKEQGYKVYFHRKTIRYGIDVDGVINLGAIRVYGWKPSSQKAYLTGLHEVGHAVFDNGNHGVANWLFAKGDFKAASEIEARCWVYAIKHSTDPYIEEETIEWMDKDCLCSYDPNWRTRRSKSVIELRKLIRENNKKINDNIKI